MKKLNTILVIAAVAAVGCAKTEVVNDTPDVKIGYQVANYMTQTKADDGGFLKELEGLGVDAADASFESKAFINADNGNGGHSFNTFFEETIVWNSTATQWEPDSKEYYWPKSPKSNIDFFSWYNYGTGVVTPTLNYSGTSATMTWTNTPVPSKADILFADIAFHQQKNTSSVAPYGKDGVTEGVPTLFHHALAQVKFTAKIKDNCDQKADSKHSGKYTFWEVKLSNLAIAANKIHANGTLTLTGADPDTYDAAASITPWTNAAWTNAETPSYVATNTAWFTTDAATGAAALTTTTANLIPDTHMGSGFVAVRPQAIGDDVTLGFKMTITTYYGTDLASAKSAGATNTEVIDVVAYDGTTYDAAPNNIYTATGIQLNKLGASPITAWEMNHKYTYNLIIDPSTNTILYDPAVEAWAAESTGTANIPE